MKIRPVINAFTFFPVVRIQGVRRSSGVRRRGGAMEKGYVHLYTGSGKGKTTTAMGLALRAYGSGLSVYIMQFMKKGESGEIAAFVQLGGRVRIEQCGNGSFYDPANSDYIEHRGLAKNGYDAARAVLMSGEYDCVVLDEIIGAVVFGLVTYEELLALIELKPAGVELVLTGRDAPSDLYDRIDLVTEMKEHAHYFRKGVAARKGIEW
jgi:cob(I)alamin adenosyltransferase